MPFLTLVIFNNVFSHEETGCNSVKNNISQKRNVNRKKPHTVFSQTSDY